MQNNIFHRDTRRYRLYYDKDEGVLKFSLNTHKDISLKEIQESGIVNDPTQDLIKAFEFDTIKDSLEEILFFFASFATFLCEHITDKDAQVEILQRLRETKNATIRAKLQKQ